MSDVPNTIKREASSAVWVRATLRVVWVLASFGMAFFARDLGQTVAGWPLNFWLAAQGSVLVFIGIVVVYAWWMNRHEAATLAGREGD